MVSGVILMCLWGHNKTPCWDTYNIRKLKFIMLVVDTNIMTYIKRENKWAFTSWQVIYTFCALMGLLSSWGYAGKHKTMEWEMAEYKCQVPLICHDHFNDKPECIMCVVETNITTYETSRNMWVFLMQKFAVFILCPIRTIEVLWKAVAWLVLTGVCLMIYQKKQYEHSSCHCLQFCCFQIQCTQCHKLC